MTSSAAAVAAALAAGAASAVGATPVPAHGGVTLSLLLYASAGAFAGLAKNGPSLWRSILPPEALPGWAREVVRAVCLCVMLGVNTVLGLAATWLLNRYVIHSEVEDLWPFAVLVCFAIQRTADPVLNAVAEVVPAWIRLFARTKGPEGKDS